MAMAIPTPSTEAVNGYVNEYGEEPKGLVGSREPLHRSLDSLIGVGIGIGIGQLE
jgi:hypothetical protein